MSDPSPLYVGQLNTPDIDAARSEFRAIFERRFYTNHGPLVAEFERRLADRLGVAHVICMTNGTVALMVGAAAAGLTGDVITPAFTFPATVQALSFAGLNPVLADVSPEWHSMTPDTARAAMADPSAPVAAIAPVRMWGRSTIEDDEGFAALANELDAALMFDAAHALGAGEGNRLAGGGGLFEVFSFHATKVLNCAEGGCLTTNDDAFAAAARTAANFHDRPDDVDVRLRINAKMSEAQAAMGLLGLDTLDAVLDANAQRYAHYRDRLDDVPGLRFVDHAAGLVSNHQYVVIEVEDGFPVSQAALMQHLHDDGIIARRYFYPGMHEAPPYNEQHWDVPVTDGLCNRVLQLPSGEMIDGPDIDRVCRSIEVVANRGA
jgi:dTDP-4-amino-4,6-dideoxygalactose transaminase